MKDSGFTLVEILIAIALVGIFIPAITTIFSLSLRASSQGEKFSLAYALAQQSMEEIFHQKGTDSWEWTTVSTNSNVIPDTQFTRTVEIADSYRCGADAHLCDCSLEPPLDPGCTGASVDYESRKVIVTVSWIEINPEPEELQKVKLEAYVTKH